VREQDPAFDLGAIGLHPVHEETRQHTFSGDEGSEPLVGRHGSTSAVADGQSVLAAYNPARVQMELDGLYDADLPILHCRPGVDPQN